VESIYLVVDCKEQPAVVDRVITDARHDNINDYQLLK
jgi:hypothetical protein